MNIEKTVAPELTKELADKIWKDIQKRLYDEQVSKDIVLHHLKQLKAQMGKEKSKRNHFIAENAIQDCMNMIDAKIKKVSSR